MMEETNVSLTDAATVSVGDVVKATVTKVEDKQALVDVGYKYDGLIPISELSPLHVEKVSDVVAVGDTFEVKVIKLNDEKEELVVSKKAVAMESSWSDLEQKMQAGEIIEAVVKEVVKGGLVVDVGVRGFIPASMVERHFVEDFSDYKGKSLTLKVVEMDKEKNKVILSHKAVLEDEAKKQKGSILDKIQPGQVLEGTVQRMTDFGVFVDIGGVDGLVHVSELAWNRVDKPSDVVKEGDKVTVKVLKVDKENERIGLSIKETQAGPWAKVAEEFKAGSIVAGTVKRLVSFGAFVEVAPGIEGLVHISQIANRRVNTPGEVLKEGQEVQVKILDVVPQEQRISLSIRAVEEDRVEQAERASKKEQQQFQQENNQPMGVTLGELFADLKDKFK
ncbi:30S ribosomal protein S1 [Brevibacillus centrosporus]|jgi:small subunit ribosomal protein S1|uniref:Small subunit ribosomal protein S1 n=1 Tax=Brevibacillus centrosporus TaxID=54910 RepID=A0A1I3YV29_9BACL|nr:30S ribosomal protein S1 [Brevibacillus centrosporus]MEC2127763.1 30S ribosomal protein S1 [Brevibacillus centrosporus]MED1950846.1 30S ribosomal protein S1 [Brevibacillus centrosporus]MED4910250.1 30S ribosomal protein S1 [Brevibacillus centrosporus]RNB66857.1 30S ribosomal protein S1 [Brevibacillus centrosporus]SFK35645.1 small subunit ribosomal protein S1 [Brevibacillus centrosporus]